MNTLKATSKVLIQTAIGIFTLIGVVLIPVCFFSLPHTVVSPLITILMVPIGSVALFMAYDLGRHILPMKKRKQKEEGL